MSAGAVNDEGTRAAPSGYLSTGLPPLLSLPPASQFAVCPHAEAVPPPGDGALCTPPAAQRSEDHPPTRVGAKRLTPAAGACISADSAARRVPVLPRTTIPSCRMSYSRRSYHLPATTPRQSVKTGTSTPMRVALVRLMVSCGDAAPAAAAAGAVSASQPQPMTELPIGKPKPPM